MKVNKEEIVSMWIALETFMEMDMDKEWRRWQKQIDLIETAAASVNGVSTKNYVPEIANHVPTLDVTWDKNKFPISGAEFQANPDIVRTMSVKPPVTDDGVRVIRIEGVDFQPCGGTHVRETGEIGRVRIGKIEKKGKMNRRINIHFDG